MFIKGVSKKDCIRYAKNEWDYKYESARKLMGEVIQDIVTDNDDHTDKQKMKEISMRRLETILVLAIENNKIREANQIIDSMNKLQGLYEDNSINLHTDAPIKFLFDNNLDNLVK